MAPRSLIRLIPAVTLATGLAACGNDETPSGTEDHTPVDYTVLVDGVATDPPFTLTQGQTVAVQLMFVNAEDEDLDDVEAEHFAGLTFDPASLATVTRDPAHNYRFTVMAGTPGSGTVQVSFGHDEEADETSFTPVEVRVEAAQ